MLDDSFIADTVRRTNTLAFRNSDGWKELVLDFFNKYLATIAELRDWERRVEAHKHRLRDEPQLRFEQRPCEATDDWQYIHYTDPFDSWHRISPWPREPKLIVKDGKVIASVYPKEVEPYEYDVPWNTFGWTPPELLPNAKPVLPLTPLNEDAQYQESDLGGNVFALTCFHDTWGPRRSENIRPINPWGFSGAGPDRGFTGDSEEDNRSLVFLIKMRQAESLAPWQVERLKAAIDHVENALNCELQDASKEDRPEPNIERNPPNSGEAEVGCQPGDRRNEPLPLSMTEAVNWVNRHLQNVQPWSQKKVKNWLKRNKVPTYSSSNWSKRFGFDPPSSKGRPTYVDANDLTKALADDDEINDRAFEAVDAVAHRREAIRASHGK